MKYIPRLIENKIQNRLFKQKVIIVYGARQVGKTTLVKQMFAQKKISQRYLNCENLSVVSGLQELEAEKIKAFLGNYQLIILDEAQNIPDIGKKLKLIADTYPNLQIIATGSSSFDLMQKISEPLTGRTFTNILPPFSIKELKQQFDLFSLNAKLENILRFGTYPEVFCLDEEAAKERLMEITSNYLYKDAIKFDNLRNSSLIKNLLQALAMQIGQEVSYQELAIKFGVNRLTIQKYLDILEQCFIVFHLSAFSRNLRKEISKSIKVYFYDLGIRNSLIENFNRLEIRNDRGALWENFCILERLKNNLLEQRSVKSYFWRTYTQKEIDYIEEGSGKITGYEFKWQKGEKYKAPIDFISQYQAEVKVIDQNNYWQFLGLS